MRLLSLKGLRLLRRATDCTPRLVGASLSLPSRKINRLPRTTTAYFGAPFHSHNARTDAHRSNTKGLIHENDTTQQSAEQDRESDTIDQGEEKGAKIPAWQRERIEIYFSDLRFERYWVSAALTSRQTEAVRSFLLHETNDAVKTAEAMASEVQGLEDEDGYFDAVANAWVTVTAMALDLPNSQPRFVKLVDAMYGLGETISPFNEDKDLPEIEWANAGLFCIQQSLLMLVYSGQLYPRNLSEENDWLIDQSRGVFAWVTNLYRLSEYDEIDRVAILLCHLFGRCILATFDDETATLDKYPAFLANAARYLGNGGALLMARLCKQGRPLMGDPRDMITIERWRSWELKLREVLEREPEGWIVKEIEYGLEAMDWAMKESMEEDQEHTEGESKEGNES
ncbi:hypothetical protein PgNI_10916 [Pyricularia grisea]|uniref:Uncharacterized protein n=1 Tax=Pyricularia grisea TaxID=148305 RepID=A0A6P8AZC1_PYRGI|nr:hypothetical protein PgNI_10916 [Pyricularia grisea]TLD07596.1 hypothetical protein PgNI_10916 [Pyricularia grisea]